MTPNMVMAHDNVHIHRILELKSRKSVPDQRASTRLWEQGYLNNKYKTNSYMSSRRIQKSTYQVNNIEDNVMNVGLHQGPN